MYWQVRYYTGQLPLHVVTSDDMSVSDLPEIGVIDITITDPNGYSMVLTGADAYYLSDDGTRFGLINDDDVNQYFRWIDGLDFIAADPPDELPRLLYGIEIPDEEAREIGLI